MGKKSRRIVIFILALMMSFSIMIPTQKTEAATAAAVAAKSTSLSTPSISSVKQSKTTVTVKWSKVSGASGYYVYRSTSKSSGYKKIATIKSGSTVSYKDTDSKSNGKKYYYKVRAYKGSTKSSASSAKGIKYMKCTVSSLTNTASGVKIKWAKVSGATGYYIYRKSSSDDSYTKVKTITSGSTVSYTDTKVKSKNGKTYTYYVQPYNSSSKGAFVKKKIVRLTGVSISSVTGASKAMTVKYAKNSKATGYQIQYSTSSDFSTEKKTVTVSKAATTSKKIGSLTNGKKYYVRIRAYKTVSDTKYYSEWSTKNSIQLPEISQTSATMWSGDKLVLKMTGTTNTVAWTSSDASVASVNSDGQVTANKSGTATITAKVGEVSYTCKVKVNNVLSVSDTDIDISGTGNLTVNLNGEGTVEFEVGDTDMISCEWSDTDSDVLIITGKKIGDTTITLTNSLDSQEYIVNVTVSEEVKYLQKQYVMAAAAINKAYNSVKYPSTIHLHSIRYTDDYENSYGTVSRLVLQGYGLNGFGGYSYFYVVVICMDEEDVDNYTGVVEYNGYYMITSAYNNTPGMYGDSLDNATALKAYQIIFDTTREFEYD